METTREAELGFYNDSGISTFSAKVGDTARSFIFKIADCTLTAGCIAIMYIVYPDNKYILKSDLKIDVDNQLIISDCTYGDDSIFRVAGKYNCELQIIEDSKFATTWKFVITVEDSVIADTTMEQEFTPSAVESIKEMITGAATAVGQAKDAEANAKASAADAVDAATISQNNSILAKSWAVGGTDTRTDEDIDNSKYYSNQSKKYFDELSTLVDKILSPKGIISFEALPTSPELGDMYTIQNAFSTTSDFMGESGVYYPAGTSIYYSEDNKWVVMSPAPYYESADDTDIKDLFALSSV